MKKYLKSLKNIIELSPALAVALTALLGFQLTTPTLNDVILPEKPEIRVEAKEKKVEQDKKEDIQKTTSAVGNYKDGVFSGIGIGYGGPMTVQVSVAGGQITTVEVLDNNETENFLNMAKAGIIDAILDRQTWEVDSVSGATYSSRGIKEGVCNALTGLISTSSAPKKAGPKTTPVNSSFKLGEWADGSYEGTSRGFGGPIKVRVVIKKGKIKSIKVLSHSGETPSYFNKAKSVIKRIVSAQSPNVDTVSGATYSSGGIREAVKNALKKAGRARSHKGDKKKTGNNKANKKTNKKTDPNPEMKIPEGIPADGTYTGKAICQQEGRFNYSVTVTATYKDGKLIDLIMTSTDTGSNEQYIERAWKTMKTSLLTDISGDVDVVTSATYTSNAIKTAYKLAYKAAVEANGGSSDRSTESVQETTPVKEDDLMTGPKEGHESDGKDDMSGSHNGEAELSGTPADGKYSVVVSVNSYDAKNSTSDGWFSSYHLSGTVTFSDGKLVSITKIVVGEDAEEYEIEDDDYYTSMAAEKLVSRLIEKQSNDVDTVTGATCSSKGIIALYEEAFRQAVKDYKEPDSDQKETGDENKPDTAESPSEKSKPDTAEPASEKSKSDAPEPAGEESKPDTAEPAGEKTKSDAPEPAGEESKPDAPEPAREEAKPDPPESAPDKDMTSGKKEVDKEKPEESGKNGTEEKDGGTGS